MPDRGWYIDDESITSDRENTGVFIVVLFLTTNVRSIGNIDGTERQKNTNGTTEHETQQEHSESKDLRPV